jgi:hypothetical protein
MQEFHLWGRDINPAVGIFLNGGKRFKMTLIPRGSRYHFLGDIW